MHASSTTRRDASSRCWTANASSRRHSSSLVPALATVLVHILLYGTQPQAHEGTAAHIWQLLIAGQLPMMIFYSTRGSCEVPE